MTLSQDAERTLTSVAGLDEHVARVDAEVRKDHYGEDALFFRVFLRDTVALEPPSAAIGQRLQTIAAQLRHRVAGAGVPMFSFVSFVRESEAHERSSLGPIA